MVFIKVAVRVVAAGLLLWMGYQFLVGPTIEFDNTDGADLTVRCSPVTYYIAFDYEIGDVDATNGPRRTYEVVGGDMSSVEPADLVQVYQAINTYCDRARTSRAATIGLLSVPTVVLAVLALRRWASTGEPASSDAPALR